MANIQYSVWGAANHVHKTLGHESAMALCDQERKNEIYKNNVCYNVGCKPYPHKDKDVQDG